MFCGNCGTENLEGANFCKNCGNPLVNSAGTAAPVPEVDAFQSENPYYDKSGTSVPKAVWAAIACGVIVLIAIIAIIAVILKSSNTINLNKYMTVKVEGYDGYGKATASIDWEAIENKYGKKVSFTKKAKEEYSALLALTTPTEAMKSEIEVSFDKDDELANGDVIKYSWNVEDELSEYVNCKVKYKDGSYTVSGLQEIEKFDAFADLEVTFEGASPSGRVDYNYNGSDLSTYDFSCDSIGGLSNGDVVKITLDESYVDLYAEKLGKIPSSFEKEYTVEGLDEYIGSYSDLTEDFVNKLKKEAEDTICSYTSSSYNDKTLVENLEYSGYILNTVKDAGEYASTFNDLYMIYSATVSNTDNEFASTVVYFPVRFNDILKSGESFTYEENYGIVGSTTLYGSWWYSTKGYDNQLFCFMDIADDNSDTYNSESGGSFEKYSKHDLLTKLDDVTDSFREKIQADAKAYIENYIAKDYSESTKVSDLSYVGEYFLISKDEDFSIEYRNKFVTVFSAELTNSDGAFDKTTVYFPVSYCGVVKLTGDEMEYSVNDGIEGYDYLPDSYYSTNGYVDGTKMYSEVITERRDDYTYEVSEGLQQFGK